MRMRPPRSHRLVVRTPASHVGNAGSTPAGINRKIKDFSDWAGRFDPHSTLIRPSMGLNRPRIETHATVTFQQPDFFYRRYMVGWKSSCIRLWVGVRHRVGQGCWGGE